VRRRPDQESDERELGKDQDQPCRRCRFPCGVAGPSPSNASIVHRPNGFRSPSPDCHTGAEGAEISRSANTAARRRRGQ
jgi:hypothetical protein